MSKKLLKSEKLRAKNDKALDKRVGFKKRNYGRLANCDIRGSSINQENRLRYLEQLANKYK